jgi:hypothetical protein
VTWPSGRAEDARGERGAVGGVEVLPLAVVIFVAGLLVVANLWALVEARLTVTSAAREAVRTYVEAADHEAGWSAAGAAAARVMGPRSGEPGRFALELAEDDAGRFSRCNRIIVRARYRVPALTVPWLGGLGQGVEVTGTATEVVDPYRDGLAGVACGS